MKRKRNRKTVVRELDNIFSRYIRSKTPYCVCCGSRELLQCGHLFSRTAYSTRWDPDNAFTQCTNCNLKHEFDPYPLTNYFLEMYGKQAYDDLHKKYSTVMKFSTPELEELFRYYKLKVGKQE